MLPEEARITTGKIIYICSAMRVFHQLDNLPSFRGAVVTIGSFDGVHRGHQQLLARINRLARRSDGESVVITFHPHPRQVIYPRDKSLRLLTTIEEKIAFFERYGVDNVVVVPFTVEFSQQSADEYIQRFLVDRFHPHYVVIGYDHRFGLNRQGDIDYLKWHSEKAGFEVVEIAPQEVDDIAVSSTKIRRALDEGKVRDAARLLGHDFVLTGKVVRGQQIGQSIGFPTANLQLSEQHKLVPPDGIYAVRVYHQEVCFGGMLYIGPRPTIKEHDERTIEVNIFDFNQSIYGDTLKVEFVDYIREDQTFSDLDGLKDRLVKDKTAAEACLLAAEKEWQLPEATTQTAIVILNYNGVDYLRKFLPSVLGGLSAGQSVVVADNGSTDHSLAVLEVEFPQVDIIRLEENLGFAGGYNEALRVVDADYYVLLNSDVEVTDGWLEPCIAFLEGNPKVAACQPKILSFAEKERFEYAGAAGGWLDSLGYPFCRGRIFSTTEQDKGQYNAPANIFWATGAALVIRADLFHQLEGFDADYFAHAEEIDLCWRLKRAGYSIWCLPDSVVYHVGGGTLQYQTVRKTFLNFRNTLITSFKNEPAGKLLWWFPLRLLMDALAGVLFLFQGKWDHIWAIIRAHWQFFPRMAYWRKRRRHYDQLIDEAAIGPDTMREGVYEGSIVWQYYALGRRHFREVTSLFNLENERHENS